MPQLRRDKSWYLIGQLVRWKSNLIGQIATHAWQSPRCTFVIMRRYYFQEILKRLSHEIEVNYRWNQVRMEEVILEVIYNQLLVEYVL